MDRKQPMAARTEKPFQKVFLSSLSNRISPLLTVCASWLILLPHAGNAAEWRVQPSVRVSETYTDNVALASPGQERDDFISEITPGISIFGRQGLSEVRFSYSPQILIYADDSNRNRLNHLLSADGTVELGRDWLFLDAGANMSRETTSALGPIGLGNDTGTQNQTSVRSYRVSPNIRNRFGPYANYEIRYQRDGVSGGNDLLSNSKADKYVANMRSGTAFNRYSWAINLYKENVDYSSAADQSSENASVDLRYFLTPSFALTATEGYEKYNYLSSGNEPKGNYWGAGIAWQPSNLTNLSLSTGRHYYGRSYGLDFLHRSRTLLWKASYSESVATTRSNFLVPQSVDVFSYLDAIASAKISDTAERARIVHAVIAQRGLPTTLISPVNFLTSQAFLEKRGDASVAWNSGKTTVVFSAFQDTRDTETIGSQSSALFGITDFNNSNNIRQRGANLLFNWLFAPKTSLDLNNGYTNTFFRGTNTDQKFKFIRAGLRHQLTTKATGALDLRHVEGDSSGIVGSTYEENAISASLNLQF